MMLSVPIKTRAGLKFPPLARNPMTIGTTIEAKLPAKLKIPPVKPIKCFGDNNDTNTQEIRPMPIPKKESDMNKIMSAVLST